MIRIFAVLLWCVMTAVAAVSIGSESAVAVGSNAHYSSAVNIRPGNNELVRFNPPTFSWFYNTNYEVGGEKNANGFPDTIFEWTNVQHLLIYDNVNLTGTPVVDVRLPYNFYGALPPFDTNATRQFWWIVIQERGGSAYWTNPVQTFTIANGATNVDRSMLADTNYLATNLTARPILAFRSGQEAALYEWMQTQGQYWKNITNAATALTNASYFTDGAAWPVNATVSPTFATMNPADAASRVVRIGALLLLKATSGDNRWTNATMTGWLTTNLQNFANWFNSPSNNWAMVDLAQPAGAVDFFHLAAAGYDWGYDFLGSDTGTFAGQTRTNLALANDRINLYEHFNATFYVDGPYATYTTGLPRYDWAYPSTTGSAAGGGLLKLGISHFAMMTHANMANMIVRSDSAEGRFAHNWKANYVIARTSPYTGFAAHHVGPYGYVDTHTVFAKTLYTSLMVLDRAYPQAQWNQIEFSRRFPDWFTRLTLYNQRKHKGTYGDGAPFGYVATWGDPGRGYDLAAVTRSGLAMQAYNINSNRYDVTAFTGVEWLSLPLRWHYTNTPAPLTNSTSAVYPEDGYVIASQISPGETNAYSHGVGFSFQARPRGNTAGHDIYSDMSPDMWAYGANLTDAGGLGLDSYGYNAAASDGLFVNGYGSGAYDAGIGGYLYSPMLPVIASIINFTNSGTNFVYCAADGTGLFTNKAHVMRGVVTKVRRDILFVRSKYWVIYDSFTSTSNCTFGFRWHVPWAYRYTSDSPLSNETDFGAYLGSNSLVLTTNGFTYDASNWADSAYTFPQRIPVHVMFGNDTNQIGLFAPFGTDSLGSGGTSKSGTSETNSTLNPFLAGGTTYATGNPDVAAGIWVTNRVAATNWHLMTVIVPQQPGVDAPTFLRLDDNTVAVTYDGVTETNTFGTAYGGAYTYQVATLEGGENPGGGGEGGTPAVRTLNAVRTTAGRMQ